MIRIFLFDGTCNGDDDEFPTNIRLIRDLLDLNDGRTVHYYEGPGNDEDDLIDKWFGSTLGLGHRHIRDEAYDDLMLEYAPGDLVAVFGFSRGAAIARMFCQKMADDGIETDFLGCFDTVAAFLPFGRFQQDPLFGSLDVSVLVKQARHAVALDEDRAAFAPRLMNARDGVVEMWFRGNHADIGGGYEDDYLSGIALQWMLKEAFLVMNWSFQMPKVNCVPSPPHSEALPLLREQRMPVVLIAGEVSKLAAQIHPSRDRLLSESGEF
ncbi:MAG: DUF2235 domain-containing protein [Nitrospinaceae bacterium]